MKPQAQQKGDSAPERIAAFRRHLAENLALGSELSAYWKRTRDQAERELEVIGKQIEALAGTNREDPMDEEAEAQYARFRQLEWDANIRYQTACEMVDKLALSMNGDDTDEVEGNQRRDKQGNAGGQRGDRGAYPGGHQGGMGDEPKWSDYADRSAPSSGGAARGGDDRS